MHYPLRVLFDNIGYPAKYSSCSMAAKLTSVHFIIGNILEQIMQLRCMQKKDIYGCSSPGCAIYVISVVSL